MSITLPALPYAKDALAPHISEETLDFHYGKHHQSYVTKLNGLIEGKANAEDSLEKLIADNDVGSGIFNNAAQVYNHTFYWSSMKPGGGGKPTGELLQAIEKDFGSFEAFKEQFTDAAATQFGSGWAWLVKEGDQLSITKTVNADTPIKHGQTPLLTIDVWEHAYYIDFRNARPKYIDTFLESLVNWDFVAENFSKA